MGGRNSGGCGVAQYEPDIYAGEPIALLCFLYLCGVGCRSARLYFLANISYSVSIFDSGLVKVF